MTLAAFAEVLRYIYEATCPLFTMYEEDGSFRQFRAPLLVRYPIIDGIFRI